MPRLVEVEPVAEQPRAINRIDAELREVLERYHRACEEPRDGFGGWRSDESEAIEVEDAFRKAKAFMLSICRACEGSGRSSRDGECTPCAGTGKIRPAEKSAV